MKLTSRLLTLIALIMLASVHAPANAESTQVYVVVNNQKFYEKASSDAEVVFTLGYGADVKCTGIKDGWARIKQSGVNAFCPVESLSSKNPNKYSRDAYINADGVEVYKRPSKSAASKSIKKNTLVTVVAVTEDEKWCRVKSGNNYGYVRFSDLSAQADPGEKDDGEKESESFSVYVSSTTLKIRKSADESAQTLATAGYGDKLICTGASGAWAKVQSGSKSGWCKISGLTKEDPNDLSYKVYANNSKVKIREYPSSSAPVITTVTSGTSLKATAATPDGKWLRVKGSDQRGYVLSSDISQTNTQKINSLLTLAMQQLGKPYVYATRGPETFDCTGFTIYCYAKYSDIELGRSAEQQGYDESMEKIKSIDELRRGDIVCFDTDSSDDDLSDHVGIYLGNGKFIHASSAGKKVMISSLDSGYYNRTFSWGRRIFK